MIAEKEEKTSQDAVKAALFLVPTPIGNLKDITLRALDVLREVDLIACEDTRHTRKLLSAYGIHTPLVSYEKFSEKKKASRIVEELAERGLVEAWTSRDFPGLGLTATIYRRRASPRDPGWQGFLPRGGER